MNGLIDEISNYLETNKDKQITISYGEFIRKVSHVICCSFPMAESAETDVNAEPFSHWNFCMKVLMDLVSELFNTNNPEENINHERSN